jgi:cobalamin biosynthesis protein CobT
LPYRYSSIRHTHITEEIKKTISMKQTEITGAIAATDKHLADVESTLGELRLAGTGQEGVQNAEDKDKDSALEQIEEERIALDSSRKLLKELLSMTREEVIAKATSESQNRSTQVTFGNQNSGFQIGISNGPISGISFGGKGA